MCVFLDAERMYVNVETNQNVCKCGDKSNFYGWIQVQLKNRIKHVVTRKQNQAFCFRLKWESISLELKKIFVFFNNPLISTTFFF